MYTKDKDSAGTDELDEFYCIFLACCVPCTFSCLTGVDFWFSKCDFRSCALSKLQYYNYMLQ